MGLAIAGLGIAAVGTATQITSAAMQADAAKKAAGASSGAGKKFVKQQTQDVAKYDAELQAALSTYNANITGISSAISNIDPKIKIPDFSLLGTPDVYKTNKKGEIIYDKKTGLPKIKNPGKASAVLESIKAANLITENSLYQIETVLPGAADAREKAMEDIKVWEGRLEDQYNQVQKAYPLLNQAGEVLLSSEDKLKLSEDELKKVEQRLIKSEEALGRSEGILNRSEARYDDASNILNQQLPLLQQARDVAGNLLLGDLPDVTKRQITRAIAEAGGAGYNPAAAGRTSGFQVPQGMLSQNLAEAAEERQRFGLSAVSNLTGQTAQMSAGQANIAQGLESVGRGFQSAAQGYQSSAQGFGNLGASYGELARGYQNMGAGLGNLAQGYGAAGAASANLGEAARGMQATNMAWQNLSQGFLQNVPQMMGIALTGRGQDIDKKRFEIQAALEQQQMLANLATGQFNAATNVAGNIYDARSGLTQSRYGVAQTDISNQLASRQAGAQMVSDIGQGIGQLGTSAMGAYNQYATAAGPATRYSTYSAAQQSAPYAGSISNVYGMGYVPRATAV